MSFCLSRKASCPAAVKLDNVFSCFDSVVNVFKRHYKKIIEQHYNVNKQKKLINKFF